MNKTKKRADALELMRAYHYEMVTMHERQRDEETRLAVEKMMTHHHKNRIHHIGPTYKVDATTYLNLSVSKKFEVVMTVMESTDSICKHGNRICFCGEWDISSRVMS
ncbi:hypothetical protein SJR89_01225 [Aeromonas caviae]|uniref:hypothetical protein n=1 Tax=Aeromonas caviae TaxID=648 RepID=UPI0029D44E7D|nr:hypothetical protein [Aeromonas caviae]MDX7825726.1 hypothetical protein [Aeromonas caviae]